jgi:hypothetical protein
VDPGFAESGFDLQHFGCGVGLRHRDVGGQYYT